VAVIKCTPRLSNIKQTSNYPVFFRYNPPFDPKSPCGDFQSLGDFGLRVKRCLEEGGNHLKVVGKAQVDFMNRTEAPLGTKFKKYVIV